MHLAWLLVLSGIAVQAIPLETPTNGIDEFPWNSDFEACEEAVNCQIVIDEDGDRVLAFVPGMEPGSEVYMAILNGTENDPAVDITSRGIASGDFQVNNRRYTARGMTGHKWVEFGCTATKGEIDPAARMREALVNRCPDHQGGCYPGPWSTTIQYMGGSVPYPQPYTWQLKAVGTFFPGLSSKNITN